MYTEIGWCDHAAMLKILKFIDLGVFEIFDHKMQISLSRCDATCGATVTILYPTRCAVVRMSSPEYEVDRTTGYC